MISPAMPRSGAPEWPSARWVGAVDASDLVGATRVRLRDSDGYAHARFLVRSGVVVHGFVDVPVASGWVDVTELTSAIARLSAPPATTRPALDAPLPSITVLVCTRDRADQLRTSLAAILRLDYPRFNVVVVDNASRTSATRDLLEAEFSDPRIELVEEPVAGLSRARNTGLLLATGDIVAFTDDDVVVDPHWLRQLAGAYAAEPGIDCVSGLVPSGELRTRVQGYFDDRVTWSKSIQPRIYSIHAPPADLPMFPFCVGQYGTGANFSLRRSAALELGGFDTAFGVGTRTGGGEDLDMFTRVLLSGRSLAVAPSAIVWHRHRDDITELKKQAKGYGTGLGSWLTKLILSPRTLPIVLVRAPRALVRLVSIAWRKPAVSVVESAGPADEFDRAIARVGWVELASVARGPWLFLRQRLAGERTM
ncbi:glycosyl transferase family 2 [Glaciihabitans tibetensis]|uniref:Glycosyl transferase family 2 n=1 Tax=Glaciihabitans tibetensis TaxID=1266600 RepID=A0A2T0VJK0_9MICO|nr:glycosyltransferase family 2 protein [Glaciihabitans tibetensis]PRY70410.1 glycosyl transferase family 2 [Glaciihabitans tibetensis]